MALVRTSPGRQEGQAAAGHPGQRRPLAAELHARVAHRAARHARRRAQRHPRGAEGAETGLPLRRSPRHGRPAVPRRRPDDRHPAPVEAASRFDAEKGHIEVEAGMQWPQLLQVPGREPEGPRAAVDLRAEADRGRQAHHRRLPCRQHPRPRPEDAALHRRRRVVQAAHRQGRRGRVQPHRKQRAVPPGDRRLRPVRPDHLGDAAPGRAPQGRARGRGALDRRPGQGVRRAHPRRLPLRRLPVRDRRDLPRLPEPRRVLPATSRSTRKLRSRPTSASCARATGPSSCTSRITPRAKPSGATPASTCRPTARSTGRTRRR